ncbi:MAG: late competence development ComFB family protein [Defluviitaleaceae bacterium]|nr:late competence development ComFB family protein [Defluviitaleaceae bacterium]
MSNSNIEMKNYMEDCVVKMLPAVLEKMDICKCERCQMDIAAYALNYLPPKYVVARTGRLYAKLDSMYAQFNVDVATAVTNGAKMVSKNPRHDEP